MTRSIRLLGVLGTIGAAAIAVSATPAQASEDQNGDGGRAVLVQTNDPAANAIAVYHRNSDGTLTYSASYPTGGKGGRETGSGSDPLASQGSLKLIREDGLLLAVNAGGDTISVFRVDGDHLALRQVLPSGGPFPTGLAVHGNLVYVLDAGGQGFVSGYRIEDGSLHPIANSTRALLLGNAANPFFLSSPAEAAFTPGGGHLIITTKTHNTLDVFAVGEDGRLSAAPVKNAAAPVPFAIVFDSAGRLVLNFAGNSSLETFTVNPDNTITPVSAPASDGQAALCWVTRAHGFDYAANTGSGDVSQFKLGAHGSVTLVDPVAASGISGAIDMGAADGRYLYVESGLSSSVRAFSIGDDGSLTPIQVVNVPDGANLEGIAVI